MESNPEIRQMMNDPAMLDQAIQMMRNPDLMRQQMRSQELAMSQLENMPGGFSALSSMYRNIQEPLMDAQTEGESSSTQATQSRSSTTDGATGSAMPNPWGSPAPAPPAVSVPNPWGMPNATSGGGGGGATAANPWASMMGGAAGGMPTMPPGMMNPQNMDPNQMMQILDNPMVQQMMEQMVDQNPDAIRQMLEAQNPMLRQLFQSNPEMGNQMVRQMMNPQALRSMLQLQQAMGGAGMPGMGMGGMTTPGTSGPAAGGGLDFSNLLAGASAAGGQGVAGGDPLDFSNMMQQLQVMQGTGAPMMGGMGAAPFSNQQHPADRYRSQLQSLRDMGFDDEQQCLAVLQQNHGNLNRAVDALLMGPPAASSSAPAPASPSAAALAQAPSDTNNSTTNNDNPSPPSEPKDATEKKND
jgi:ubiquilin